MLTLRLIIMVIFLFFTGFSGAVPAANAGEPDIRGTYKCVGDAGKGKTNEGTTQITKQGDCYVVSWRIASGQLYSGIALREGKTLSVAVLSGSKDTRNVSILVYRIEEGKAIQGQNVHRDADARLVSPQGKQGRPWLAGSDRSAIFSPLSVPLAPVFVDFRHHQLVE